MQLKKLGSIFQACIDFLFPPSPLVKELEILTAGELAERLPRSREHKAGAAEALFDYRDQKVRALVWELKYRGNRRFAKLLAQILYDELLEKEFDLLFFKDFTRPIITSVPLSAKRFRERGFNQMDMVIEELAAQDLGGNFEFPKKLVKKVRHTLSQTSLKNRLARWENLRGCFKVTDPAKVAGRNIIILDDVLTTGSTIEEMRSALFEGGARKVIGLCIAH